MERDFFISDEIGDPKSRVDGKAKVTGAAKYAAEHKFNGLTYGVLVNSIVARGSIKRMDTKAAENAPGVLAVISHENSPKVPGYQTGQNPSKPPTAGQPLRVFYDNTVYFYGQPIALVIADTFERAFFAASLVKAEYDKETHITDAHDNLDKAKSPKGQRYEDYKRGEVDAYKSAPVKVEAEYIMPIEVHNPIELHSIIATWEGEKLTVYTKTQGVKSTQRTLMDALKLKEENVQVFAPYVGGGFGAALRTWPHEIAAVIGSQVIKKPVKVVLHREQMFTMVGYRPYAVQKIGLGATPEGKLIGITHEATSITSTYEEFAEGIVAMSKFLYASPNVNTTYKVLPINLSTPTWMRGPGEATGAFALESALDELAHAINLDPVEFRVRNYTEIDPERNLPFSSKFLKEAYQLGADKIGWKNRKQQPGSIKEGDWSIGYGMSSGTFNAGRGKATAKAKLLADGTLLVQSAVADSGPGTATAMTNIAADSFGISTRKVKFELGDSSFPPGPTQGGSTTTSTLGSAVHDVCLALQQKILQLAAKEGSPFAKAKLEEVSFKNGEMLLTTDPSKKVLITDILKQNNLNELEMSQESVAGEQRKNYSMYSFSVHFAKVKVHRSTGVVRVIDVASVADAGTIVNRKTAGSQIIGGVVGGIGMALMEESVIDHRFGRHVNNNLADYHVPVHADIPHIEPLFVDKPDPIINPMGSKGLGEIALIGFAAAVANAVFNATGKRIRELPITPDKLMS